jgi:hypothetical protein
MNPKKEVKPVVYENIGSQVLDENHPLIKRLRIALKENPNLIRPESEG